MAVVWLVAESPRSHDGPSAPNASVPLAASAGLRALGVALARRGVKVHDATMQDGLLPAAVALYDGRGAVVVDAQTASGQAALSTHGAALVPIVAVAPLTQPLPAGVLRLAPGDAATMAHHIVEVLRAPDNLRRHPRVPVELPVTVGGLGQDSAAPIGAQTLDISLYGLRCAPVDSLPVGAPVAAVVELADGARVRLVGTLVDRRGVEVALRCRPASDADLLLWVHLLISELEQSPLHGELDPLGPLFE